MRLILLKLLRAAGLVNLVGAYLHEASACIVASLEDRVHYLTVAFLGGCFKCACLTARKLYTLVSISRALA